MGSDSVMAPTRHPFFRPRRQDDTATRLSGGRGQSHRGALATRSTMKLAFCPACGAAEKPVLVMTPYYACPECETVTPREKLEFKRKNLYTLAGTNAGYVPPFSVVATATLQDLDQLTATMTTSSFTTTVGDLVVALLGTAFGSDSTSATAATISGGEGAMVASTGANADNDTAGIIFAKNCTTAGSRTIQFGFNNTPLPGAAAAVVVVFPKVAGHTTTIEDGAATFRSNPTIDSGLTGALLGSNDVALSMFAMAITQTLATPTTFGNGFTKLTIVGTDIGGGDCSVAIGSKVLAGTSPYRVTGSNASIISNVAATVAVRNT